MKNKAVTYLLLTLVVGLWGYIIYKVFAAVSDDDPHPQVAQKNFAQNTGDLSFYSQKKTTALLLNYPDPMLKNTDAAVLPIEPPLQAPVDYVDPGIQDYQPEPPMDIQYIGFIENINDKKPTAIVMIIDRQYMMNIGDQQGEIKLMGIQPDHILIKVNGKSKTIFKHEN